MTTSRLASRSEGQMTCIAACGWSSQFGKVTVLATDGHLPYPYGRETTGYDVDDLPDTLMKAKAAGASVVIEPYSVAGRRAAIVQFPGGLIAEIHSDNNK